MGETAPVRRFPPPWTVEETDACFIVKDHTGMSLAYVYFEGEPGRRAAAKLLTSEGAADRREYRQAAETVESLRNSLAVALTRDHSHFGTKISRKSQERCAMIRGILAVALLTALFAA
jgi:hypothetical protein